MTDLDKEFWSQRYKDGTTGWDMGRVSPPIKAYVDQLDDKSIDILIPGGGRSYEAEYFWKKGFRNVHVIDIAPEPLHDLQKRSPDFPAAQLHEIDFFDHEAQYDLIIEQTFFCALDPNLRKDYVYKMHSLLRSGGKLCGVMFNFPLTADGPPFGGSKEEYLERFEPYFEIKHMEDCYNSIEKRKGRELFLCIQKKELDEKV